MDRHVDDSCNRRVYYLHHSFIIVHTERGQWQASFTQEKSACLMEVSLTEHNLPSHKSLGDEASSCLWAKIDSYFYNIFITS